MKLPQAVKPKTHVYVVTNPLIGPRAVIRENPLLGGVFKYFCYLHPDPWGNDPI